MKSQYVVFNLLNKFQNIGVGSSMTRAMRRNVVLCNSLSLLVAFIPILFTALVMIERGPGTITIALIIQPLILISPVLLNALKWTTVSRIMLSWITPSVVMVYSIYNKTHGIDIETSSYVSYRITMVAWTIIPFLLFSLRERWLMFLSLSVAIIFILGFDPLHSFFGVGYSDVGLSDTSYPLTNIRALMGIIVIGSCALILKNLFEKSEKENEEYILAKTEQNKKITSQLEEISTQHENSIAQKITIENQYNEILKRESSLIESKNQLAKANEIINSQQELLKKENLDLEEQVLNQNIILEKTNTDLLQVNADLQQFLYMASHNMRGPIASLLGLFNIVPVQKLDAELLDLLTKSKESAQKLNDVVADMNHVGSMSRKLVREKETIYWNEIVESVIQQFEDEINEHNIDVQISLENAPPLISIKELLHNILSNLMSNSIKFRSLERDSNIQITVSRDQDEVCLEVTDNGLGMDLERIGAQVFMMYKRFHDHVLGRGLGLYFIKTETELLDGTVSVTSAVNRFTTFTLKFPLSTNISE